MTNRITAFSFLVAIVVVLSLGVPTETYARGGISSGGGDAFAAEFVHLGGEILNMLKRAPMAGVPEKAFQLAVQNTQIFSQEVVSLNGRQLDAVNTPAERRVVISRTRWSQLRDSPRNKLVLVAHEYFSIMGLADRNYAISNAIFSRPGIPVVSYVCDAFREFEIFGKLRLQFLVFQDFYSATVTDENGVALDETGGFSSIYTYNIQAPGNDPSGWKSEWLVTTNAGFTTRIVSLDASDSAKSGKFRMADLRSLNPVDLKMSSVHCTVTRN